MVTLVVGVALAAAALALLVTLRHALVHSEDDSAIDVGRREAPADGVQLRPRGAGGDGHSNDCGDREREQRREHDFHAPSIAHALVSVERVPL